MTLRLKLFAAFIVLIIVPMCLLGALTVWVSSDAAARKYSEQAQYALKAISYSLTGVFEEMNKVTDNGIATSVFRMALSADDPGSQNLNAAGQLTLNDSQRNFRNLLYNYPDISYAYLYNLQGNGKSPGMVSIFTKENFTTLPFDSFRKHSLYQDVMAKNGNPVWIAPYEYPELSGSEPVFTQIRLVKELNNFRDIGILVVQIKNWQFDRIFRNLRLNTRSGDTTFMLANNEGLIVYDQTGLNSGKNMAELMEHPVRYGSGYQSFRSSFQGDQSMISIYHLKDYPWNLVSVTPWSSLTAEFSLYAFWFVVFIILCLAGAILFNILFMNRITDNIALLVRFMRRVEEGDLSARVKPGKEAELRVLGEGFNSLMDKIGILFAKVSSEQEQKARAELRVLQAQIKPHFLFNTLESINGLAVRGEGRRVSEMVIRLASMLRTSIQEREEITLAEEINHLRSYLEIQQYRFSGLFTYEITIPEELKTCLVLKLTLQPLVENAIQHGFEGMTNGGLLRIAVWEKDGDILLEAADNGSGIPSDVLGSFQYMIREPDGDSEQGGRWTLEERRGLGVRNVADRIRIQYGRHYGIFICSHKGLGTVIRCKIPKYS
ncbi:sensor histidine kinase [Paenibacillus sp. P96]|uniref:Sensor histidine kinase n=1 Tax=Paenibacillus zeirhizosphaerae TaxID=2987519 RepID=A0ABT9FPX7_9BACL|nr:sensor histidine kinase [Paenibacillus sp. P96]MDP4096769.1 sensor histidine kinase [Paenibacillus sp. P96]